jgi:2-amino-4-hydroxy-6-hydroxymethyldihydropteridine diphosphokinase
MPIPDCQQQNSVTAFLSLGSNTGYRIQYLSDAVELLSKISGISVSKVSTIYETTPTIVKKQIKFLNCCVKIQTTLSPQELLQQIHNIESTLHRKGFAKLNARTIDIDILLYGDEAIFCDTLIIPHERMFERAFMLIPLLDVFDGNAILQAKIKTALLMCDSETVVKYCNELLCL